MYPGQPYLAAPQPAYHHHHEPFAPLPTDSPSPSLHRHDFADPLNSSSYFDPAYPSYGQPAPPPEAAAVDHERHAASIKLHDVDSHAYRHSPGKASQLFGTFKSRNQLVFLGLIALQAIVVLVMIALVYAVNTGDLSTEDFLGSDPRLESVATYLGLFILAVIFEILITLDAMQKKNIMTLFVLCLFQVAMLVYSAVLPGQLEDAIQGSNADTPHVQSLTRAYAIVIPAVVGACSMCMTAMLWPLYHEFGWNVLYDCASLSILFAANDQGTDLWPRPLALSKRIGADLAMKRFYALYQVFACLLKFDAFFLVGFSVQFLILVSGTPTAEFVLTIIALPISLLALVLFAVVVRAESRTGVYCSFVLQAAGMAYFAYKISRIYNDTSSDRYSAARATLTIFSVLCLVMLLATFILMGLCMLNFGKGLKERIPGYAFRRTSIFPSWSSRTKRASRPTAAAPSHADGHLGALSPSYGSSPGNAPSAHQGSEATSPTVEGGGVLPERSKTRMSLD
ncbi:hypothetical protein JCM3775_000888 [Rhodotorula graminis]